MKIMERIGKLLRLGQSDNANESAMAVGKAQAMMTEHNVTKAMLDEHQKDDEEEIEDWDDALPGVRRKWRSKLLRALCKSNGCHFYVSKKQDPTGRYRYHLIGGPNAALAVRYLWNHCNKEMDRLVAKKRGNGRAWLEQYRLGVAEAICASIELEKLATYDRLRSNAKSSTALVVVDNAIEKVEQQTLNAFQWGASNLGLTNARRLTSGVQIPEARDRGREDGASVYPRGKSRQVTGGPTRQIGG